MLWLGVGDEDQKGQISPFCVLFNNNKYLLTPEWREFSDLNFVNYSIRRVIAKQSREVQQ